MKKNILIALMALFTIGVLGYTQYENHIQEQKSGDIKLIDGQEESNEIKDIKEQEESNEIKDINEQEETGIQKFIDKLFNWI